MEISIIRNKVFKTLFLVVLIGVDQLSKFFISNNYKDVVINENGSWGILPWWSSIIGIVLLTLLEKRLKLSTRQKLFYIVIMAGGISNIIDRIIYNGVVDFIRIGNFPVFNIADVMVSVGCIALILVKGDKIEE